MIQTKTRKRKAGGLDPGEEVAVGGEAERKTSTGHASARAGAWPLPPAAAAGEYA